LVAGVLKSTDDGATWKRYGAIATPTGAGEPSLAQLKSGDILMVLRTGDGFLWETMSKDKGETWSAPTRTDISAAETSHNIFQLSNGRLLLTLNESTRLIRTPLNMRISSDEGKTWSTPLKITEVAQPTKNESDWAREVSYPSVAELKDGTVIVVWAKLILSDTEQYGDIESARVQIQ
jgi:predicted neuraminidase